MADRATDRRLVSVPLNEVRGAEQGQRRLTQSRTALRPLAHLADVQYALPGGESVLGHLEGADGPGHHGPG